LWPRRGASGNRWPVTLLTFGAATIALVWLVIGLTGLQQTPSFGLGLLIVAVASVATISGLEMVRSFYHHRALAGAAQLRASAG